MTDTLLLRRKLATLAARVERARDLLPADVDRFIEDRDVLELVAFNFLLAAQEALDIAARLISQHGWGIPETARAHFTMLAERDVIPLSAARALSACVGVRNLIAHSYGVVDPARLHDELPSGLDTLEAFARAISTRLDDLAEG